MAGYGTKKPFGDRGVQLTFPLEFQRAYNLPQEYFPSYQGMAQELMIGRHGAADYHEQKRLEANRTVMIGLQARKSAERKLLTGPHNYHLPKAVLGQRRYANPSYGDNSSYSGRRDNGAPDAPFKVVENGAMVGSGSMVGGVLRTTEAREFYRQQLDRRISQLDRLDALAQGYAVPMGQPYERHDNKEQGSVDKVELFVYLRALGDSILEGDYSRFTFENIKELVKLLTRFSPYATREDFNDIFDELDIQLSTARDGADAIPALAEKSSKGAYAATLIEFLFRMREYVAAMFRLINLPVEEKIAASKAYMKRIPTEGGEIDGFEKLLRVDFNKLIKEFSDGTVSMVSGERRRLEDFDGSFGGDEDDDGSGDGGFSSVARLREGLVEGPDGRFRIGITTASTREDDEASGVPRAPFAGRAGDPARERYGRETGRRIRGEASYYGEEEYGSLAAVARGAREEDEPYLAYPLGAAGFDPNAMGGAPRVDPEAFRRAVEEQISEVLRDPLGFTGDIEDVEEFVNTNYPDPSVFVREVVRGLEEKSYTPAQIANGMEQVDIPALFGEYIAEHSGDVGPAPAAPARSGVGGLGGIGALPPPVFRPEGSEGSTTTAPPTRTASEADWAELTGLGFPRNRSGLAAYKTAESLRALMGKLPAKFGGPIRSGADTKRSSLIAYLVRVFRSRIDPNF
jgi:hypothetical protein